MSDTELLHKLVAFLGLRDQDADDRRALEHMVACEYEECWTGSSDGMQTCQRYAMIACGEDDDEAVQEEAGE